RHITIKRARTWPCGRMLHYDDLSNDLEPLWSHQSCPDCIIATRGYDFREGQALTTMSFCPSAAAAACTFLVSDSMFGLVGFTSRPPFAAAGTSSCSNSNSFGGSRLPSR